MIPVIVLAAGAATRMGRLKQLLPWGPTTLLGHAVDVARASTADQVIVVLGCQADALVGHLAGQAVRVVVNEEWVSGLASSVRAGLAAVPDAEAAVFLPVDQPRITPDLINQVIATYRASGQPIVVPRCAGRRAPPILFARAMFPALRSLTGDQGGRVLIDQYAGQVAFVELADATPLTDVDTPADYEALRRLATHEVGNPRLDGRSAMV